MYHDRELDGTGSPGSFGSGAGASSVLTLYEPDAFDEGAAELRQRAAAASFADIPREEHPLITWKLRKCEAVRDLLAEKAARKAERRRRPDPADPADAVLFVARSNAGLANALALIKTRENERARRERGEALEAGATVGRAARGGSEVVTKKDPGVKALRGWLKALEDAGWDPLALRMKYHLCGSPDLRIQVEVERLMARAAKRYASANRPTKNQIYKEFVADVEDANRALPEGGEVLRVPSRCTFYRRIRQMSAYFVYCARWGLKRAQDKFRPVTEGVGAKVPGERVEIDEWNVQLHVLLIWGELWDGLGPEQRDEAQRIRVWVCVAIDCATRVLLGMAVSQDQSSDSVLAVLRMVVSDKTAYARAVGARSPWNMAVRPKTIVTDAGSTFLAERVRAAMAALRIDNVTAVAGQPWMRGVNERVNSTFHTALISRMPGRTFEHPVAKGDYQSEGRAAMTVHDLCWTVARWGVDEYHNTPHQGLGGETPANCWLRLTKLYGIRPLPGPGELRNVFGIDLKRHTGPRGVGVLGLHYQGAAVQEHRRRHGDGKVQVRYDPADVGWVSVQLGDDWHPVRCVTPGFDGVSMADWRLAALALRKRFGREAKLAQPIVNQAVREIRAVVQRSLDTFGLGSETPSTETIERYERDSLIAFRMPERDEDGPMPDLFDDEVAQGGAAPASADAPASAGSEDAEPEAARPAQAPAGAVSPEDGGEAAPGRAARRDVKPTPKRRRLRLKMKD